MTFRIKIFILAALAIVSLAAFFPEYKNQTHLPEAIMTGADQTNLYVPYLQGKRIGMLVNQTSLIGHQHAVDSLLSLGIDIKMIFGPEHGFRGNASNGAVVDDEMDVETGIKIISLYGKKRKPSKEDLENVDLMVFDIQDVGCRFYTNINTLADVMEACAENGKELLILDRPNPNAYVDGPVLDMKLKSGIGKFPIPMTHGMTLGEFAHMLNGEGWLQNKIKCKIRVIKVADYNHQMAYELPVKPSPNLNTQQSVLLYPSLCLFEGTIINYGRGTHMPFTILGNPDLKGYSFSFTPVSIAGMSEAPLHQNQTCYGIDLRKVDAEAIRKNGKVNLQWLLEMYNAYPYKEKFFDFTQSKAMGDFDKLAGTTNLKQQIINGASEAEIRKSWEPALSKYKEMRKKYLLYP